MTLWHSARDALVTILEDVTPTLENIHTRPRYDHGNDTTAATLFADSHGRLQGWYPVRLSGDQELNGTFENTEHGIHILGRLSFDDTYATAVDGYTCSFDWFEAAIDGIRTELVKHVQGGPTSTVTVRGPIRWTANHEADFKRIGVHEVDIEVPCTVIRNFTAEA